MVALRRRDTLLPARLEGLLKAGVGRDRLCDITRGYECAKQPKAGRQRIATSSACQRQRSADQCHKRSDRARQHLHWPEHDARGSILQVCHGQRAQKGCGNAR